MTSFARRYRLPARPLVATILRDGAVRIWSRTLRAFVDIDPIASLLLRAFGTGATEIEAAETSGVELDDDARATINSWRAAGLLEDPEEVAEQYWARSTVTRGDFGRTAAVARQLGDVGSEFVADAERLDLVTGTTTIDGRPIVVIAFDPSPVSDDAIERALAAQDRAYALGAPIVYIMDTFVPAGGEQFERMFGGVRSIGRIYRNQGRLTGVIPQVGVVVGEARLPASFPCGLCDALVMTRDARVFIGGPAEVKQFLGEDVTADELGGAAVHARVSGLVDEVAHDVEEALAWVRRYLNFAAATTAAPVAPMAPLPDVPDDESATFDMRAFVRGLVDGGSVLELRRAHAPEIVTAWARLAGAPVGIIANDAAHRGGILGVESARKAARFVELCGAYRVPIVFLADTPGFLIGRRSEHAGVVAAAGTLFRSLARATVPKLTVIVRKAYSAGYYAMCGAPFDPDALLALPNAAISIYGARTFVEDAAAVERALGVEARADFRAALRSVSIPAATWWKERGIVDEVVKASGLRDELVARLAVIAGMTR